MHLLKHLDSYPLHTGSSVVGNHDSEKTSAHTKVDPSFPNNTLVNPLKNTYIHTYIHTYILTYLLTYITLHYITYIHTITHITLHYTT